jgi:small subunit ribosomal protein S9
MPDDEQQQNGEQSDEQPEGTPEEGTPEEQQADEQQAPEEATPSEGGSPERGEGQGEPPEVALSEDAATEDDTPAEERGGDQPRAQDSAPARQQEGKREDVVPGAELDPIAIEPERELDAEERARREAEEEERLRRERELIGDVDEDATPVAAKPAKLEGDTSYAATGKRKSSVARVILRPGSGTIQVNKRTLEEYFPRSYLQSVAKQPLTQTGYEDNVDVRVRVHGGGVSGQAAAVRHGIARALVEVDPALRPELKRRGLLTRDARVKERRKAGLKKARKRPQFSKR